MRFRQSIRHCCKDIQQSDILLSTNLMNSFLHLAQIHFMILSIQWLCLGFPAWPDTLWNDQFSYPQPNRCAKQGQKPLRVLGVIDNRLLSLFSRQTPMTTTTLFPCSYQPKTVKHLYMKSRAFSVRNTTTAFFGNRIQFFLAHSSSSINWGNDKSSGWGKVMPSWFAHLSTSNI